MSVCVCMCLWRPGVSCGLLFFKSLIVVDSIFPFLVITTQVRSTDQQGCLGLPGPEIRVMHHHVGLFSLGSGG